MSATDHTFQRFGQELDGIKTEVLRMGKLAGDAVTRSIDAIVRQDMGAAAEVARDDERLDALKREIEEEAIRLLALRHPLAQDLRRVIAALKVSSFLERIGDFARDIARRGIVAAEGEEEPTALWTRVGDLAKSLAGLDATSSHARVIESQIRSITEIGAMVGSRLDEALQAYESDDADLAERVWRSEDEVNRRYIVLLGDFMKAMSADQHLNRVCVSHLFLVKNFERIGDYVASIAEIVHYEVTGDKLDGEGAVASAPA